MSYEIQIVRGEFLGHTNKWNLWNCYDKIWLVVTPSKELNCSTFSWFFLLVTAGRYNKLKALLKRLTLNMLKISMELRERERERKKNVLQPSTKPFYHFARVFIFFVHCILEYIYLRLRVQHEFLKWPRHKFIKNTTKLYTWLIIAPIYVIWLNHFIKALRCMPNCMIFYFCLGYAIFIITINDMNAAFCIQAKYCIQFIVFLVFNIVNVFFNWNTIIGKIFTKKNYKNFKWNSK